MDKGRVMERSGPPGHAAGALKVVEPLKKRSHVKQCAPTQNIVIGQKGQRLEFILGVMQRGIQSGLRIVAGEQPVAQRTDRAAVCFKKARIVGPLHIIHGVAFTRPTGPR